MEDREALDTRYKQFSNYHLLDLAGGISFPHWVSSQSRRLPPWTQIFILRAFTTYRYPHTDFGCSACKPAGIFLSGGNNLFSCGGDRLSLQRDEFERKLVHKAIAEGVPIFAVCRGS